MTTAVTNKAALVSAIATQAELSDLQAEKVLNTVLDGILNTLTKGESVSLVGFGNFGVKARAPRKMRNPRTGEEIMVAATAVPFFKAGKNLKDNVDVDAEA